VLVGEDVTVVIPATGTLRGKPAECRREAV
jgi:hypothetical protein